MPTEKHLKSLLTNFSVEMRHYIVHGYSKPIKADYENVSGLTTYRDELQEEYAKKYNEAHTDQRIEVGIKYPHFNLNNFKKRFGLKDLGVKTIRRYYSNGFRDSDYQIYQDNLGNYFTSSLEYSNFSKGGYLGCVFNNEDQALNFVKWLCGSKTHYFKDLDVGYNSLGGLGTKELDEVLNGQEKQNEV